MNMLQHSKGAHTQTYTHNLIKWKMVERVSSLRTSSDEMKRIEKSEEGEKNLLMAYNIILFLTDEPQYIILYCMEFIFFLLILNVFVVGRRVVCTRYMRAYKTP